MTRSMASVRETIKSLRDKQINTPNDLDTKDGISLLSLKHHVMLSYLQSLVLLGAHRAAGHSLATRTPPELPFSAIERGPRGADPGDLVDSMLEGRVVLEKVKALEGRMRYQIEKLVRVAEEVPNAQNNNVIDDPLAFRPNPQALMDNDSDSGQESDSDAGGHGGDGIYRPPKLAPMPYTETTRVTKGGEAKSRRKPLPSALASLAAEDPSRPHMESTSGLGTGGGGASRSARAREIARMNEFEEENFTRLVLKKKDAKRRQRDEEDIALGGSGGIRGLRRGGGFEDAFGDVLRSVGRKKEGALGDGYEELRKRGRKGDVLERSRARREGGGGVDDDGDVEEGPRPKKRSRFEKEAQSLKKRTAAKSKR
ncbi:hypothetical protein PLICRDRAFT_53697 [Plicaturopsis crispa FD-325 SS-3]|nr:hypothetical protein PLICRDRAFT_53697 [Plicaturopsis crispa FD-325 SS-3]